MSLIKENELIELVNTTFELPVGTIDANSSMDNVEKWDSLGHLGILVAIDKRLEGKASEIKDLATAASIQEIIEILKNNFLA